MGVNHRRRHFVWLRVRKQFRILLMARSENRRRYKIRQLLFWLKGLVVRHLLFRILRHLLFRIVRHLFVVWRTLDHPFVLQPDVMQREPNHPYLYQRLHR